MKRKCGLTGNIMALGLVLTMVLCIIFSCSGPKFTHDISAKPNPHNISPLTALLEVETSVPSTVSIKVLGEQPVEQHFDQLASKHSVPVVGLYPGRLNEVEVSMTTELGSSKEIVQIQTPQLPSDFPTIEIDRIDRSRMENGMHACDVHLANRGKFKSIPMIFDDQGVVRWYLDLSFNKAMIGTFQRLSNGKIAAISRHIIFEFDMLGKMERIPINPNYGMHHDMLEMPNGDLLILVGKRDVFIELYGQTVWSDNDCVILFDRKKKQITKEWDLAKHLDVSRDDLNTMRKNDWIHINAIVFDERDSSLLLSGKQQGISKISWDDELQWILAPHQNWGRAGRKGQGKETAPYLLDALDTNGKLYAEPVQMGTASAKNFDFPWGQHGIKLLDSGNILLFDNGNLRNYNRSNKYSRAVEYKIDEENGTVEQVWQYGKERGEEFYSSIVSDVDLLPETKNILITSGFVLPFKKQQAKIVEIDPATGEEIFEATLYMKSLNGNKTESWGQMDILYRSERMELKY